MATKNYTTKTAFLRATKADVRTLDTKKLFIDGKNILDYISDSEFDSYDTRDPQLKNDELDIWNTEISLSDNGHIEVKPFEHTNATISSTQSTTSTFFSSQHSPSFEASLANPFYDLIVPSGISLCCCC